MLFINKYYCFVSDLVSWQVGSGEESWSEANIVCASLWLQWMVVVYLRISVRKDRLHLPVTCPLLGFSTCPYGS